MNGKITILTLFFYFFVLPGFAQSPYIYKVYEYMPAPGQFVNELPQYEPGDKTNDLRLKAEESIADNVQMLVSLGGYGGYIVFGFDHMVENVTGEYDFKILANAFYANANPNPEAPKEGGSCEPGIVMVSYDANGNGKPDDAWYELAGSEYNKPETIRNYRLTYYKPDEKKEPTPDNDYTYLNDTTYIRWSDNRGKAGYVSRNVFHDQSYYPLWVDKDELVFEGTKLADNYVDESGNGSYYVLYAYDWGYVDNHPNTDDRSSFKIDWAVDAQGNPVHLPGIHFIKVYTGVNQYCGWLGETSTEITGAIDLHVQEATAIQPMEDHSNRIYYYQGSNSLLINTSCQDIFGIYSTTGVKVKEGRVIPGLNRIDLRHISSGVYIVTCGKMKSKIIKQ